jgi:hypothetical protein
MAKSKDRTKDEYYRGQLRELSAENRRLKKQVRELEKHILFASDFTDIIIEDPPEPPTLFCNKCKKGYITTSDLGIKLLHVCNSCGYRETHKK